MKTIILQGIITSIRSKVDRSIAFSVSTPELSQEEVAMFFQLQGINAELQITPEGNQPPEEYRVATDIESKSPSQRMRAVLFILWKQDNEGIDFDQYYKIKMERVIESWKSRIED